MSINFPKTSGMKNIVQIFFVLRNEIVFVKKV